MPQTSYPELHRRRLLQGSAALGLSGLSACAGLPSAGPAAQAPPLASLRARPDRLFDVTVCLRPFRAAGPRLDTEQVGDVLVVHNYGHGGSGWSLSWGSSTLAVQKALAGGVQDVAVLGCGALGLTSATLAQRAGARVTIYAKDLLPQTRSSRATGSWTPDSRIALASAAGPGFGDVWEQMARISFKTYRQYLGLPGRPVEWSDRYYVFDHTPEPPPPPGALDFASYRDRIADLTPRPQRMAPGETPFRAPRVERTTEMMFNIADYGHTLMSDFLLAGGRVLRREFHHPSEFATLPQKVVINCPGYAARELWGDTSVVPVRGQIGWLIPQADVGYGAVYHDVLMLARRDGVVIQDLSGGDMKGYGDADETPRRSESERAVEVIADL
ncbi:MAG TPA: FAD-dependent oxidoreductase, partial [Caulobacteraceae bacterium]|nr:FAD-dependent oxidoreductase [Caulobacteraceae bacterium]